jgi:superoxide dismutase, Cu-Zn family
MFQGIFGIRLGLSVQREIVMRRVIALSLAIFTAACSGGTPEKQGAVIASADLMQKDAKVGSVSLTQAGENVAMSLTVDGLKTGTYGMHIHEAGKCEGPDFKSAGAHWNPTAKQHGAQNPGGAHGGDLENLVATNGQASRLERQLTGIKLTGEGGLLDTDGAAFIIHAGPDDMKTDPSGNSGDRIICGVFKQNS